MRGFNGEWVSDAQSKDEFLERPRYCKRCIPLDLNEASERN